MSRITVQQLADEVVAPQYRQPVKTLKEALAAVGWAEVDRPTCCGKEVVMQSFLGDAYFAQCEVCRKFIRDVTGPIFGNGHVTLIDSDTVDLDTDKQWICGTQVGL